MTSAAVTAVGATVGEAADPVDPVDEALRRSDNMRTSAARQNET